MRFLHIHVQSEDLAKVLGTGHPLPVAGRREETWAEADGLPSEKLVYLVRYPYSDNQDGAPSATGQMVARNWFTWAPIPGGEVPLEGEALIQKLSIMHSHFIVEGCRSETEVFPCGCTKVSTFAHGSCSWQGYTACPTCEDEEEGGRAFSSTAPCNVCPEHMQEEEIMGE